MSLEQRIYNLKNKLMRRKYNKGNFPTFSYRELNNIAKREAEQVIKGEMELDFSLKQFDPPEEDDEWI
ncbi:MAG: hypothetical protein ACOCRU_02260 [bacterium]